MSTTSPILGSRWRSPWPLDVTVLSLAASMLALTIVDSFGTLGRLSLPTVVGITLAVALSRARTTLTVPRWAVILPMMALQAGGIFLVYLSMGGRALADGPSPVVLALACALLLIVGVDALLPEPFLGRLGLPALLVGAGFMGYVFVIGFPTSIDVLMFQEVSTDRLLAGTDPYGGVYPHDYTQDSVERFYAPGIAEGGILRFGFPYPPLSLLLVVPGALVGDVRAAHLIAVLTTGAALWYLRAGEHPQRSRLASVLFLTSPFPYFVAARAWTEPLVLMLAALLVLHRMRAGRLHPVLLGLLLAVKQYIVLLLPLLLLLRSPTAKARDVVRLLAGAVVTAAVVTLPFLVWNPDRFWFSVVELQFLQPFRPDSLSLLALSVEHFDWPPAALYGLLPFAATSIVTGAILWRRRGRAGVHVAVWGSAVLLLAMFLVSKQAFSNYYLLAFGFLCLAVATSGEPDTVRDEPLATVLHDT